MIVAADDHAEILVDGSGCTVGFDSLRSEDDAEEPLLVDFAEEGGFALLRLLSLSCCDFAGCRPSVELWTPSTTV